jgi:hypothetical protein
MYDLFNDAVNNSGYIASNDWTIVNMSWNEYGSLLSIGDVEVILLELLTSA